MKKIAIITLNDNNNYGNRLQNYAVQTFLTKIGVNCETVTNIAGLNDFKYKIKHIIKSFVKERYKSFLRFNKNIKFAKIKIDNNHIPKDLTKLENYYDYFIVGSDQVWNPTLKRFSKLELLYFVNPHKRVSFSASFGIEQLPQEYKEIFIEELIKFKAISVRETAGKKIVEDLINRKDVEVLIDPTMMLSSTEWDKVLVKPKQLSSVKKSKYIFNYFLGELSEERKEEIERIAKENDCHIINILDKKDPFYATGPSEFLYLEKNAFLICTDSFHSSVFAILFNTPFIVFDREDQSVNMSSRLDTLLLKFKLVDRKYNGKITDDLLKHDYSEAYKILEEERKKSEKFLKNALDIKE